MPTTVEFSEYCKELSAFVHPERHVLEKHLEEVEGFSEEILARLDELSTMLEAVGVSTAEQRAELEPSLVAFTASLAKNYSTIDQNTEALKIMRQAVDHMETEVAAVEAKKAKIQRQADMKAVQQALNKVVQPSKWDWSWVPNKTLGLGSTPHAGKAAVAVVEGQDLGTNAHPAMEAIEVEAEEEEEEEEGEEEEEEVETPHLVSHVVDGEDEEEEEEDKEELFLDTEEEMHNESDETKRKSEEGGGGLLGWFSSKLSI